MYALINAITLVSTVIMCRQSNMFDSRTRLR